MVEHVVETRRGRPPRVRVHFRKRGVEVLGDILSKPLLEEVGHRLVQELVLVAEVQADRVEVVRQVEDAAVPDTEVPKCTGEPQACI